jgi:hypothetical protein
MRTWKLISGVGVAIVAAWLAVTNLAYAGGEFTCVVPATGDTDCALPKISIPARGVFWVEVYTIQQDGKDQTGPASFKILDANNNNTYVHTVFVGARSTGSWMYESNVKELVAQVRVNYSDYKETVVRGRYIIK